MEELKIKQKFEDIIKYLYIALRQFPKSEKFTLAADIKRSAFKILELIIRCNMAKDKRKILKSIDVELEILRSLTRLSKELNFLPFNKYENISKNLVEFGRMLGGWIKYNNKRDRTA